MVQKPSYELKAPSQGIVTWSYVERHMGRKTFLKGAFYMAYLERSTMKHIMKCAEEFFVVFLALLLPLVGGWILYHFWDVLPMY
jgi:hypothetical protein